MSTTESTTKQADQNHDRDRDRELVRAITDALVLAVGKRAAHQVLRRARAKSGRTAQRRAVEVAAHLAGYSALLGYIWHQRRTSHQSAARPHHQSELDAGTFF
jgi:uracil-DNA glycosylase